MCPLGALLIQDVRRLYGSAHVHNQSRFQRQPVNVAQRRNVHATHVCAEELNLNVNQAGILLETLSLGITACAVSLEHSTWHVTPILLYARPCP